MKHPDAHLHAQAVTSIQTPPSIDAMPSIWINRIVGTLALTGLYLVSLRNYLLFHSLVEVFTIAVAGCLFAIAWTSRRYGHNQYLLFIGIAYLFVGGIDLMHTLSYKGMTIFRDYSYYANQLWIGARFLESVSLLLAFWFGFRNRHFRPVLAFIGYATVTALLIASIFVWKIFPECFIEGVGLTSFKKNSEYAICAVLMLDIALLFRFHEQFSNDVFRLLLWSFGCTIASELAFTFYVDNYGVSNLVGHYFKLFSFWLIYRAIVETSIVQPYQMIFNNLEQANQLLREAVARHIQTGEQLRNALAEVKTLNGLLPICASCKKIRDDRGYWNRLESYITRHTDATFTHGYCPECYQKVLDSINIYAEQAQAGNIRVNREISSPSAVSLPS